MAEKKTGKVISRRTLSSVLEVFRLGPEDGTAFPEYKAGQYIALSRENCKLTRKITDPNGGTKYVYDMDESGQIRRGKVTHSYSIASAPFETKEHGYLEFYVVLEMIETGMPGRLSESLFNVDPESDSHLTYVNKITGEFTLDKRAQGFENVVMVGTGTGLAPFASMIKQLHHEACHGFRPPARYTLFHANRTREELGYHEDFLAIQASQSFDFVYVPSVSRPSPQDFADATMGKGRANNVLRLLFGMPLREEEALAAARASSQQTDRFEDALARVVKPVLPMHLSRELLLDRMHASTSVILTCGNPNVMEDIKRIADANEIQFEKEEW
jgi:ferredoxin-NADP reductase